MHIIYLSILLTFTFLYGEPCISNGIPFENGGNLSFCEDGTTGCDCNDDCGGSAFVDECGNCVGGSTIYTINYFEDECGVCGVGTTGPGPQELCCDTSYQCNSIDCPFCPDDCPNGTTGTPDGTLYNNTCVPTDFATVNQSFLQASYTITSVTILSLSIFAK